MNIDVSKSTVKGEAEKSCVRVERPRVERRLDGELWVVREGEAVQVKLVRCFPWTTPSRYLSLRDGEEEEVIFVRDSADFDPGSRAVIEEALVEAGFVLEVTRVDEVEEDVEMRVWKVQTRQGARCFQTALDAWPQARPDGSLLVEDVGGDFFRIPPAADLDRRSRKLIWAFLD